ncbi:outer membrane protein assembly factor BamC [Gilliamella apis]|uniref:outer membrane protein assembly factor BamC n=1 Tax=Gilliamella apis TaxID=1970738 RepID=UPI000A34D891|nr:outer membrane protein assembly factor BamC [Gilliamella apis]OTQ72866.1 hypothetical protein B6C90_10670 [Gilliamella apis]
MLNKTVLKCNAFKKIAILSAFASIFLVGCSSDQSYKREVEGNDDYLNSPLLKALVIPEGVSVPVEAGDFYVDNNDIEGALGKQLDIRPPTVPIPTIDDAFVIYNNGTVTFNAPISYGIWNNIPNSLAKQNISIITSDNNTIKTGNSIIARGDEQQPVDASYIFKRQILGETETITMVLDTLTRGNENLMSQPIEVQRYVVGLFNQIMDDVAPESLRTVPVKEKTDEDKKDDKESDPNKTLKEDLKDEIRDSIRNDR